MGTFGKCPKCPQMTREVLLTGGYCREHFKSSDEPDKTETPEKLKQLAKGNTKKVTKKSKNASNDAKQVLKKRNTDTSKKSNRSV